MEDADFTMESMDGWRENDEIFGFTGFPDVPTPAGFDAHAPVEQLAAGESPDASFLFELPLVNAPLPIPDSPAPPSPPSVIAISPPSSPSVVAASPLPASPLPESLAAAVPRRSARVRNEIRARRERREKACEQTSEDETKALFAASDHALLCGESFRPDAIISVDQVEVIFVVESRVVASRCPREMRVQEACDRAFWHQNLARAAPPDEKGARDAPLAFHIAIGSDYYTVDPLMPVGMFHRERVSFKVTDEAEHTIENDLLAQMRFSLPYTRTDGSRNTHYMSVQYIIALAEFRVGKRQRQIAAPVPASTPLLEFVPIWSMLLSTKARGTMYSCVVHGKCEKLAGSTVISDMTAHSASRNRNSEGYKLLELEFAPSKKLSTVCLSTQLPRRGRKPA